jgi:hypothetical protein
LKSKNKRIRDGHQKWRIHDGAVGPIDWGCWRRWIRERARALGRLTPAERRKILDAGAELLEERRSKSGG